MSLLVKRAEEAMQQNEKVVKTPASDTPSNDAVTPDTEVKEESSNETAKMPEEVVDEVNNDIVEEDPIDEQVTNIKRPKRKIRTKQEIEEIEMANTVKQIIMPEYDPSVYAPKAEQLHFNCANKEVSKWLSSFSKSNTKQYGGVAIRKSQATEIMLSIMYYYLDISPKKGYESHQEVYEDILAQMIDFNEETYQRIYNELLSKKKKS